MNDVLQFASLFNASAVGIVLLVSALVLRRNPQTFFRPWFLAYASIFGFLSGEVVASVMGRSWPLSLLEIGLIVMADWFLVQTVLYFRGQRLPALLLPILLVLNVALTAFLLSRGLPFEIAGVLPEVAMSVAIIWLGWTMVRGRGVGTDIALNWLGVPAMVGGGIPFLFPFIAGSPYAWVGFWLAGLANVLIGLGMVVYLLENTSARLRETNQELRQLDKMKTNFLATVGHELRTPLAAIKGAASVLATPEGAQAPQLVPIVLKNATRLEGLVADLLDASCIEAGKMLYNRQAADLTQVVPEAVAALEQQLEAKGLQLSVTVPEGPLLAELDVMRIQQVVTNLVSNAAKFTDAGGRITVRLAREGQNALLEVQDTGIGIAPAHQARIFQKFYQVESGDTRRANGSGLGLAISRSIVEEGHGGRLTLISEPGHGTTFRVLLPALEPEQNLNHSLVES